MVAYLICYHILRAPEPPALRDRQQSFWKAVRAEYDRRVGNEHAAGVAESYFRRFVKKWAKRFEEEGSLDERMRRRPKLARDDVLKIVQAFQHPPEREVTLSRQVGRGRWRHTITETVRRALPYTSMKEFCNHRPDLTLGMSPGTVRRIIRRYFGGLLCYKLLHPLKPLTKQHRRTRKNWCYHRLGAGLGKCIMPRLDGLLHYLYRTCFVDAKILIVEPKAHKVWMLRGDDTTDVDLRLKKKGIKLVFYCVVNAILGPVYLEFVTATADHEEDPYYQAYMVRLTAHMSLCKSQSLGW